MRSRPHLDADSTPSADLVARYRATNESETDDDVSLGLVHYRGTSVELALGLEYIGSDDPLDRITGADVLAQLGWGDRTFLDESVSALIPLLNDSNDRVISAAAVALGHRAVENTVSKLVSLAHHQNAEVRQSVAFALCSFKTKEAAEHLIALSADPDRDVRSWATMGVAFQMESESPEIRECLIARLTDPDLEVRGEALVGLAERRDEAVVSALLAEWQRDEVSRLSLDAAFIVRDVRLLPKLAELRDKTRVPDDPQFSKWLDEAITACSLNLGKRA